MERQRHPEMAGFLSPTSPTPKLVQQEGILVNSKETLPPPPGSKPFLARAPTQTLVSLCRKRSQESAPAHAHVRAHTHTHTQTPFTGVNMEAQRGQGSRDPLYSLSVQTPFSENSCKVHLSRSPAVGPNTPILSFTHIGDKGKLSLGFSSHQNLPLPLGSSLCRAKGAGAALNEP